MESEIIQFANSIGAKEPSDTDEIYGPYRALFGEHNYFSHSSGFLVIKISRSKKPFWTITKEIMTALNSHFSYNLILLKSAGQGWVFSKEQTIRHIERGDWTLDSKGLQYKINPPLPDTNMFFGPKGCLKYLGVDA